MEVTAPAETAEGARGPARAELILLAAAIAGIGTGGVLHLAGRVDGATSAWTATTAAGILPAAGWVAQSAKRRRLGVDVVAVLALAGTLAVNEPLAGAVITLMLATGRTLESRAGARAQRELRTLVERSPRVAT